MECVFFLNQSKGPAYGKNIPRFIKRFLKELFGMDLMLGSFKNMAQTRKIF